MWRVRRWRQRAAAAKDRFVLILTYHRVPNAIGQDPFELKVSPDQFRAQLAWLQHHYVVISMDELIAQMERGRLMATRQAVITFDDGYADNLHNAAPILQQAGLPAIVYVTSEYIGTCMPFWWDRLEAIVQARETGTLEVGDPIRIQYMLTDEETRRRALADLCTRVRRLAPGDRQVLLDSLDGGGVPACEEDRPLTWVEVARLGEYGVAVGAHTCGHSALSTLEENAARKEILESKVAIECALQRTVRHLSYPHDDQDYVERRVAPGSRQLAAEAGFASAVTIVPGINRARDDQLALRRVTVRNWSIAEFERQMKMVEATATGVDLS